MLINIKEYFLKNPNYLVAAVFLASENHFPLLEICNSEAEAFQLLKTARVYEDFMKSHRPQDFPISLSSNGQIAKMPERLAGFILAGQENFWSIESHLEGKVYDGGWLEQFSKETVKALKSCHAEMVKNSALKGK